MQNSSRFLVPRWISFPRRSIRPALLCAVVLFFAGCQRGDDSGKTNGPTMSEQKPLTPTKQPPSTAEELRNHFGLEPTGKRKRMEIRNGKIIALDLERTQAKDLSKIEGLPLQELRLNFTNVRDISPVKNMPLKFLNLQKTPVSDISVVSTLDSLNTLWLNDTPVKDLSPLNGLSLESLDLSGTPVTDLSPISGMTSLKRLNIARSAVTDVTPLEGLRLQRIILHPGKITKGLDVVRNMTSLRHMHVEMQPRPSDFLPPAVFWRLYEMGQLPDAGGG